jgi:hypothetical protein
MEPSRSASRHVLDLSLCAPPAAAVPVDVGAALRLLAASGRGDAGQVCVAAAEAALEQLARSDAEAQGQRAAPHVWAGVACLEMTVAKAWLSLELDALSEHLAFWKDHATRPWRSAALAMTSARSTSRDTAALERVMLFLIETLGRTERALRDLARARRGPQLLRASRAAARVVLTLRLLKPPRVASVRPAAEDEARARAALQRGLSSRAAVFSREVRPALTGFVQGWIAHTELRVPHPLRLWWPEVAVVIVAGGLAVHVLASGALDLWLDQASISRRGFTRAPVATPSGQQPQQQQPQQQPQRPGWLDRLGAKLEEVKARAGRWINKKILNHVTSPTRNLVNELINHRELTSDIEIFNEYDAKELAETETYLEQLFREHAAATRARAAAAAAPSSVLAQAAHVPGQLLGAATSAAAAAAAAAPQMLLASASHAASAAASVTTASQAVSSSPPAREPPTAASTRAAAAPGLSASASASTKTGAITAPGVASTSAALPALEPSSPPVRHTRYAVQVEKQHAQAQVAQASETTAIETSSERWPVANSTLAALVAAQPSQLAQQGPGAVPALATATGAAAAPAPALAPAPSPSSAPTPGAAHSAGAPPALKQAEKGATLAAVLAPVPPAASLFRRLEMVSVTDDYERLARNPVGVAFEISRSGLKEESLVRPVMINVYLTKAEILYVLKAMDLILRSTNFTFEVVAAVPAVLLAMVLGKGVYRMMLRRATTAGRARGRSAANALQRLRFLFRDLEQLVNRYDRSDPSHVGRYSLLVHQLETTLHEHLWGALSGEERRGLADLLDGLASPFCAQPQSRVEVLYEALCSLPAG